MSYQPNSTNSIASVTNNSTTPLAASNTFTGTAEHNHYSGVSVSCITDKAGILYFDFSDDGTNWNTYPTNGFSITAGVNEFQRARKDYRYFRVRMTNTSASSQTYLRLYTYYGFADIQSLPLGQSINDSSGAILTKTMLVGSDSQGTYRNVPVSADGAIDVNIAGPVTAFGQMLSESNHPIVQATAVYGLGAKMATATYGAGSSAGATSNEFYASSGTNAAGYAVTYQKMAAVYRAGQGMSFPFTARFSTPVADSVQFAGPLNGTDGVLVGYKNTTFGMFYRHGGQHEIRTLQFTSQATSTANCTITLNGTAYTVPLTTTLGVTGAAREAAASLNSQASSSWICIAVNDKVLIRAIVAEVRGGTYSFDPLTTGSAATFSTQSTGVATTEDFIARTSWNGVDTSWIDPLKGNIYRVDIQYLGYGDIDLYMEYPNPKRYELAHRIHNANELTATNFTNPAFRVSWMSQNRGSTTSVTTRGASAAAFLQGDLVLLDRSRNYTLVKNTVSTEVMIFQLKALDILDGKVSLSDVVIQSISVSTDSTKGAIFKIYLNPTVSGSHVFNFIEENVSIVAVDTAGTTVSGGRLLDTISIGAAQSREKDLMPYNIELIPSDVIVVTAQVTSGGAATMVAGLTWKEDI